MYRSLKSKIKEIQRHLDAKEVGSDPRIVLVIRQEDDSYLIKEAYYKPNSQEVKHKEFVVDDYKPILENYKSKNTRVIINDLGVLN